ncbi:hypothetical protein NOF04DRAFT_1349292 [Fusarium oxysporum II5]|nr:hypothetical protein NOF04DRAFT_1349292 [Fusarium oxysporum II5]
MSEGNSRNSPGFVKHLYLIFLSRPVNDVTAVEFIKATLQCGSIPLWESVGAGLKSNIIEATTEEAEKLTSHPDIVRVTLVEATTTEEDIQHDDCSNKKSHVVWPLNRRDKDQCSTTHLSVKEIFKGQMQPQDVGSYGVKLWKIDSTRDQVSLAEKIQGVRSIVPLDQYLLKNSGKPVLRKRRIIKPVRIEDQDQCKATGTALRDLFGDYVTPKLLQDGRICHWRALLSSEEMGQAATVGGVLSVRTAALGRRGPGPGPHPANVMEMPPRTAVLAIRHSMANCPRIRRLDCQTTTYMEELLKRSHKTTLVKKDIKSRPRTADISFGRVWTLAYIVLADCLETGNGHESMTRDAPSDRGGLLYTVFLRLSPDANKNVEIDEHIISNTIRASNGGISVIRRRPDFERVIEAQMVGQGSIYMWEADLSRDQVSQAESLDGVKSVQPKLYNLNRRYVAGGYVIDPLDRENQEQCADSGASLARLLGGHNYDPIISGVRPIHKGLGDVTSV